jgi:peptidylprolyl isomerase/FKBP-type peptidyl-prolyl cis-trans isomerase FklB
MKSKLLLLLPLISIILLSSCDDETVTFDDLHKTNNEAAFMAIANNSEYTKIESQSKAGFIMYKELVDGNGEKPLFTDQVVVRYTGWYKIDWTKEDTYTNEEGKLIKNKKIFDTTAIADNVNITRTLKVATSINPYDIGIIDGFSTALQHMEVGDKWEVWIPWQLGYGSSASGTIPAYTTLVFEIELISIVE